MKKVLILTPLTAAVLSACVPVTPGMVQAVATPAAQQAAMMQTQQIQTQQMQAMQNQQRVSQGAVMPGMQQAAVYPAGVMGGMMMPMGAMAGVNGTTQQVQITAANFNPEEIVMQVGDDLNKADPLNLTGAMVKEGVGGLASFVTGKGSVEQVLLNFEVSATILRMSQHMMEEAPIGDAAVWPERIAYDPGDRRRIFKEMLETGVYDVNDMTNLIKPLDVVASTISDRFYDEKPTLENGFKGKPNDEAFGSGKFNTKENVIDGVLALVPEGVTIQIDEAEAHEVGLMADADTGYIYSAERLWQEYSDQRLGWKEQLELKAKLKREADEAGIETDQQQLKVYEQEIASYGKRLDLYEEALDELLTKKLAEQRQVIDEEQFPMARNLMLVARVSDQLNRGAFAKIARAASNLAYVPQFPAELQKLAQQDAAGQLIGGKSRIERLKNSAKTLAANVPLVSDQILRQKKISGIMLEALGNLTSGADFEMIGEESYLATTEPKPFTVTAELKLRHWPSAEQKFVQQRIKSANGAFTNDFEDFVVPAGQRVEWLEASTSGDYCHIAYKVEIPKDKYSEEDNSFGGDAGPKFKAWHGWVESEVCRS